ncbi:MAG: M48 family metalloprotease [Syntrophobacterales bacterium]|jgi:predicted Zn-dependent protease|nr:M48 family metalloprotease [Syntrophobacterales bacterium]
MNKHSPWRPAAIIFLALSLLLLPVQSGWAFFEQFAGGLSIEKEKQIGEEFLLEVQQQVPLIQDPFLTSYLNHLGQKLVAQIGPQPFHYKFFIVDDPSMNAFAVPGGYVFIHTGMIRMAEREGELAGVMAHEISHVNCRHMSKMMEKSRVISIASLIGTLASVFLGGVGTPLLIGTMAAGESAMLKYSRDMEAEADAAGFKWMIKAGYNPRDMVSIFSKMNKQRWLEGGKIPQYLMTHPDTDNRIVELSHQLAIHLKELPAEQDNPYFQYFNIKLASISGNAGQLMRRMTQEALHEPNNPAFPYGKALALSKLEKHDEALAAFQQALRLAPNNPLIKRDLAIFYFNHNQYPEAQARLTALSQSYPQDDVVLYYLGRIYEERKQIDQALPLFEKVHKLNPTFSDVYYNLGTLYGEKGQLGLAHYYLAFYSLKVKALPTAMFHFQKAVNTLSASDPRYTEARLQLTRLQKMKIRVRN